MTDAPKTMQLSPDDWRALAILNATQLHAFLSSVPGTENGANALTAGHVAAINDHVARLHAFITGWSRARVPAMPQAPAEVAAQAEAPKHANGAAEPKPRRGGWPKGRKRGAPAEQVQ